MGVESDQRDSFKCPFVLLYRSNKRALLRTGTQYFPLFYILVTRLLGWATSAGRGRAERTKRDECIRNETQRTVAEDDSRIERTRSNVRPSRICTTRAHRRSGAGWTSRPGLVTQPTSPWLGKAPNQVVKIRTGKFCVKFCRVPCLLSRVQFHCVGIAIQGFFCLLARHAALSSDKYGVHGVRLLVEGCTVHLTETGFKPRVGKDEATRREG